MDAENIVMPNHLGSRLLWPLRISFGVRDILLLLFCNIRRYLAFPSRFYFLCLSACNGKLLQCDLVHILEFCAQIVGTHIIAG